MSEACVRRGVAVPVVMLGAAAMATAQPSSWFAANADVVVYGGTGGGFAAAIAASRAGVGHVVSAIGVPSSPSIDCVGVRTDIPM